MKLAVFSGQYFWFDGEKYSTDEAFVKFVLSFHPEFDKIVFCDAVSRERKGEVYALDPKTAEVCPLPYFSVYSFWKNLLVTYPKIYRTIRDNIDHWDLIWLPGPHPVGLLFSYFCLKRGKPFFQVVRANLTEQVRHSSSGLRRYCAMAVSAILEYASQKLAGKNLTFTVGGEMYRIYSKRGGVVYPISISLVSEKDILETLRTRCFELRKPIRLLSVGRLDPEKGLHFLVEAVDELVKGRQLDVIVQMVGKGYKGEEERRLHQEVRRRRLDGHINFLGYVSFGPKLLKLYRESDIFVLPSLTGEGVPQTIFEAMACGIPVVATKVAGIPEVIQDEHNGLLIDPASPSGIALAVERLIADNELRDRVSKNGFATATNHTMEAERERMFYRIQALLRGGLGENSVFL